MRKHWSLGTLALIVFPVLGLVIGLGASQAVAISEVLIIAPTRELGAEVGERVHIPPGATMIFFPLNRLTAEVAACPRVASVAARRDSPHRLVVRVTARPPFVALDDGTQFVIVSREGICISTAPEVPMAMPVVTGICGANPPLGCRLEKKRMAWLADLLSGATKAGIRDGLRVDLLDLHHITIVTADGVVGTIGNVNSLARKAAVFAQTVNLLRSEGRKPVRVDVSNPETPRWTTG